MGRKPQTWHCDSHLVKLVISPSTFYVLHPHLMYVCMIGIGINMLLHDFESVVWISHKLFPTLGQASGLMTIIARTVTQDRSIM